MKRFTELIEFVEVSSLLELEDLVGMFFSFLSSMPSTNGSGKGEIWFSQKSLKKAIIICTTNDHTFNKGVSKIFEFTLSSYFFQFCNKIVKTLAFKLSIRKTFMTRNDDIFPWVAILRKFIQNSFWCHLINSWIEGKCMEKRLRSGDYLIMLYKPIIEQTLSRYSSV